MLFSKSPFVSDKAEQFSYVQPFHKVKASVKKGESTVVNLPAKLQGKNVVIEIGSSNIQKFKTFYSSTLKVKYNE